ncbi:MAG: glycerol kinase GlpK [Ilumatobacteraceae bacterium]
MTSANRTAGQRNDYVLSIDAGTTGIRCRAVYPDGRSGPVAYREFTQYFPEPGWVEHDAREIWSAVRSTFADVVAAAGLPAAIGITNHRETVVAWDRRTGEPAAPAIVWQDRRTADTCEALQRAGNLDTVRRITGLVLDPYFSGTKMSWLLQRMDASGSARPTSLALGTIDSWILWNLTGGDVFATDPSNASRTMLFDLRSMTWSDVMADLLGIPIDALATVMPSSGTFGVTNTPDLPSGIPITGIAGDQQSALFGQACFRPGMAKNTYGTGSFILMNIGSVCPDPVEGLLTTVAWSLGTPAGKPKVTYALEASIFVTGAAVQWLRDGLGIISASSDIEALARTVDDNGGVICVPAFTGLGSPWWDPHARGAILGITRGTTKAHLARAVVESMALQTRDALEAMQRASGQAMDDLRVDGGASVMDLLLQIQADQLGITVRRPRDQETTSLGAAFLAGLACGLWPDQEAIAASWSEEAVFRPHPMDSAERVAAEALHTLWLRGVERSRHWTK